MCNVLRHLWDLILLGVFVCKVDPVKVCLRVCNHFLDVFTRPFVCGWVCVCQSVSQSVSLVPLKVCYSCVVQPLQVSPSLLIPKGKMQ